MFKTLADILVGKINTPDAHEHLEFLLMIGVWKCDVV